MKLTPLLFLASAVGLRTAATSGIAPMVITTYTYTSTTMRNETVSNGASALLLQLAARVTSVDCSIEAAPSYAVRYQYRISNAYGMLEGLIWDDSIILLIIVLIGVACLSFIHRIFCCLYCHDIDYHSMGEFELHTPSHKRPMHSHHRCLITPSSSTPNNDNNLFPATQTDASPLSRFVPDFEHVGTLGNGSFGSIYKVRNRMDRRMYAIKAAKREARGESDLNRMLQEVYALAALSDQACEGEIHIVKYIQAWMEGRRLHIQMELYELTLLEETRIDSCVAKGNTVGGGVCVLTGEKRWYKLLREMLLALDLVHKSGMIHLDIKPENIFIKNDQYKLEILVW